jgi:hypothetical protein
MKSMIDGSSKVDDERKVALDLAHDDGVVRAQVQAAMSMILIAVQDRVITDNGVLKDAELVSANWEGDGGDSRQALDGKQGASDEMNYESPDVVEQPVWGIDCYTRRKNITTWCIENDFGSSIALEFIEKWLLPAINACPVDLAHNLTNATRILEGLSLPLSSIANASPESRGWRSCDVPRATPFSAWVSCGVSQFVTSTRRHLARGTRATVCLASTLG